MLLPYTRKFMQTCFDSENESKLYRAIGGIMYHDSSVKAKLFVLHGVAGSGKTSILNYIYSLQTDNPNLTIMQECSFRETPIPFPDETIITTTNKLPDNLEDWVEVINTTGKQIPYEDYRKFIREMNLFSDEFFKKCMWEFSYDAYERGEFDV